MALKNGNISEAANYARAFVVALPIPLAFMGLAFLFSLLRKSV